MQHFLGLKNNNSKTRDFQKLNTQAQVSGSSIQNGLERGPAVRFSSPISITY